MHFSWVQRFDSLTDLQISQTYVRVACIIHCLIPLLIYKALKPNNRTPKSAFCLIPLLIYKALKLNLFLDMKNIGLIPLLIYKALKRSTPDIRQFNLMFV